MKLRIQFSTMYLETDCVSSKYLMQPFVLSSCRIQWIKRRLDFEKLGLSRRTMFLFPGQKRQRELGGGRFFLVKEKCIVSYR